MIEEYTGRFDIPELLSFEHGSIVDDKHLGLENDESVAISWTVPYGAEQECIDWLYANRTVVSNFNVSFRNFADIYRTVSIEAKPIKSDGRITGALIIHSLAKGWYDSINWDIARLVGSEVASGNSETIAGASSANDEIWHTIEFPYCDPNSIDAMVASLKANIPSPIVVRGQTITTDSSVIVVTHKVEEDKSRTIVLLVARPEYILTAFQDLGGPNQQDVYYVWNVPKANAQDVLDNFKELAGIGSSASASYNESQKLVDLVLSKSALTAPSINFTIPVACDTFITYYFAWGYTKTQIEEFLAAHDDTLDSGWSRQVRIDSRGNGLYDAQIVETQVEFAAAKHTREDELGIGEYGSTSTIYVGWNVPKSEVDRIALIAKAAGANNKQFQVTRNNENCTFNYSLQIDVQYPIAHTYVVTDAKFGKKDSITYEWGCSQARLTAIKAALVAASNGLVETSITTQKNKDDTIDCIYTVRTNIERVVYLYGPDLEEVADPVVGDDTPRWWIATPTPDEWASYTEPDLGDGFYKPQYVWGYNCKNLPTAPDGWSIIDPYVNIQPNGRLTYSLRWIKNDSKLSSISGDLPEDSQGYSLNRRQIISTEIGDNCLDIPVTGKTPYDGDAVVDGVAQDGYPKDVVFEMRINPQTGYISYEKKDITWRIPESWKEWTLVDTSKTWQKRSKVLVVITTTDPNKAWIRSEKRSIEINTYRKYSLTKPTLDLTDLDEYDSSEDYKGRVVQVDENLWYQEAQIPVLGAWEEDSGGLNEWVELD